MIRGQVQHIRQTCQLFTPVGQLASHHRARIAAGTAERPVLPDGVVGELHGQRSEFPVRACRSGRHMRQSRSSPAAARDRRRRRYDGRRRPADAVRRPPVGRNTHPQRPTVVTSKPRTAPSSSPGDPATRHTSRASSSATSPTSWERFTVREGNEAQDLMAGDEIAGPPAAAGLMSSGPDTRGSTAGTL